MMGSNDWARLTTVSSGLEADMLRATLETAEIPVQVRGHNAGAFGAGYQGTVPAGLEVYVPAHDLERARAFIEAEPGD